MFLLIMFYVFIQIYFDNFEDFILAMMNIFLGCFNGNTSTIFYDDSFQVEH